MKYYWRKDDDDDEEGTDERLTTSRDLDFYRRMEDRAELGDEKAAALIEPGAPKPGIAEKTAFDFMKERLRAEIRQQQRQRSKDADDERQYMRVTDDDAEEIYHDAHELADMEPIRDKYEREAMGDEDEDDPEPEIDQDELMAQYDPVLGGSSEDVGLEENAAKEPQTWFLPPPLLAFWKLTQDRIHGSWSDPFVAYFRDNPGASETIDDEFREFFGTWLDDVAKLDLTKVKSEDGESLRAKVYNLDQRLRTLMVLAPHVTTATSVDAYFRRQTWDAFFHIAEMRAEQATKLFEKIRTAVYQSTPAFKAKKKAYDQVRNSDPKVKAKAKKRREALRADPEFKAREAERKRRARAAKRLKDKILESV